MNKKYLCDIIVPVWNKVDITKDFVNSLSENTEFPVRVIFIDNNSQDGTKDYLCARHDGDKICFHNIFNSENEGFIKAVNKGLKIADAQYVCIANNDLIFTKGWLQEIISVFRSRPDVGLLNPNSNTLGEHPPANVTINEFSKELGSKYKNIFVEMTFCVGFCLVIKQEALKKVGYLSEDFVPMFFEDSDYSLRVSKAGFRLGMAKASYVWHHEHASMEEMGSEKELIFQKSKDTFLNKWGKISRIALVVEPEEHLQSVLEKAIGIAKQGNYVYLFIKNLRKSPQKYFMKIT